MGRLLHNPSARQITFCDERFYETPKGEFYPSVTTVLDAYPKGSEFSRWLKENGLNADQIVAAAADSGSKVHEAIDKLQQGIEVVWDDKAYNLKEWVMICRFVDFYTRYLPTIISSEFTLLCHKYRIAGTVDILCEINSELWLIDIKTSNSVHNSHFLQVGAYAVMFNEENKDYRKIDRTGILHLNAQTRTEGKKGKIQGVGWQLIPIPDYEAEFEKFRHIRAIWDNENPNPRPKNLVYPDRLKLAQNGITRII